MNGVLVTGLALTVAGVVGYALGIATPYPGRAFAVTAFMVGVSLAVIGRALAPPAGDTA